MNGNPMNYEQLWRWLAAELPSRFEAGQLLAFVTGKNSYDIPFCGQEQVSPEVRQILEALCRRRREGEPLQYLLGEWEFFGLPFLVGEGVLIPRADTELLVEKALEKTQLQTAEQGSVPQVLDLCAGSGCVAIALQASLPQAAVTALELSPQAYSYLQKNIALNKSAVGAVLGDLFTYHHGLPLHCITANPPYIPRDELTDLQLEVRHEPAQALDGGADGLDYYRAIAALYYYQLAPGGWLCLEVGAGQAEDVRRILRQEGYETEPPTYDLAGIARVVCGQRRVILTCSNGEDGC